MPTPPTSLHSEHGVIPHEVYSSIKVGETTREDLVLLIGAPDRIYEGERFFVYQWIATEGFLVVGGAGGGVGWGVEKKHFFCVEFDEDNKIKRFKHIQSGVIDFLFGVQNYVNPYVNLEIELNEWISDSPSQ